MQLMRTSLYIQVQIQTSFEGTLKQARSAGFSNFCNITPRQGKPEITILLDKLLKTYRQRSFQIIWSTGSSLTHKDETNKFNKQLYCAAALAKERRNKRSFAGARGLLWQFCKDVAEIGSRDDSFFFFFFWLTRYLAGR